MEGDDHGEAYTAIEWGVGLSLEILTLQGPRFSPLSKAICAAPLCEALTPCRGLRPHHVQKDCVGTWETSPGPDRVGDLDHDRKSRRRSCRGTGEESDGCTVLMKPRTRPTNWRRRVWREGGRSEGRQSNNACAGHRVGSGMSLELLCLRLNLQGEARGLKASDLRQEPGAGKPHAGICGGGAG